MSGSGNGTKWNGIESIGIDEKEIEMNSIEWHGNKLNANEFD